MNTAGAGRDVGVLTLCWALFGTGQFVSLTVASLVGYALVDDKSLATLPLAAQWAGTALSTIPASWLMARVGRRLGFQIGSAIGACGAGLVIWAMLADSFLLFCVGIFVLGSHIAFGQLYRFAAAEVAPRAFRSRAISLVLAGGVAAALVGPQLAKLGTSVHADLPYLGGYAAVIGLAFLTALTVMAVRFAPPLPATERAGARPYAEILGEPIFLIAVGGGAAGYGVMILVMSVTPIAMQVCGHAFGDTVFVIQWHALGMFAPSFFTGHLIRKFGVLGVMLAGATVMLIAVATALSGITVAHFWVALTLLGVGWNFLFVGATDLIAESFDGPDRARVQGLNDFLVFGVAGVAAFLSGSIYSGMGWAALNFVALPVVGVVGVGVLWLAARRGWTARA